MSGIVFLLCCHVRPVDAADFCPLVKPGAHCDRTEKEKNSDRLTNQFDQQGMDCCAFIPAFFDKTRTFDRTQQVVSVTAALEAGQAKTFVARSTTQGNSVSYHSVALVKNNTFLKNRTFRI